MMSYFTNLIVCLIEISQVHVVSKYEILSGIKKSFKVDQISFIVQTNGLRNVRFGLFLPDVDGLALLGLTQGFEHTR